MVGHAVTQEKNTLSNVEWQISAADYEGFPAGRSGSIFCSSSVLKLPNWSEDWVIPRRESQEAIVRGRSQISLPSPHHRLQMTKNEYKRTEAKVEHPKIDG